MITDALELKKLEILFYGNTLHGNNLVFDASLGMNVIEFFMMSLYVCFKAV